MSGDRPSVLVNNAKCDREIAFRPRPCEGHQPDHGAHILKWIAGRAPDPDGLHLFSISGAAVKGPHGTCRYRSGDEKFSITNIAMVFIGSHCNSLLEK